VLPAFVSAARRHALPRNAQVPFGVRDGETARRAAAGVARVVLLRPLGEVGGDDMVAGRAGPRTQRPSTAPPSPLITKPNPLKRQHLGVFFTCGRPFQQANDDQGSSRPNPQPATSSTACPRLAPRPARTGSAVVTKPAPPLQPPTDVTLNKEQIKRMCSYANAQFFFRVFSYSYGAATIFRSLFQLENRSKKIEEKKRTRKKIDFLRAKKFL